MQSLPKKSNLKYFNIYLDYPLYLKIKNTVTENYKI